MLSTSAYKYFFSYAILFFISGCLSLSLFFQVLSLTPLHKHNRVTFFSFEDGIEGYKNLRQEWRTRIFSNYLAHGFSTLGRWAGVSEAIYIPSIWVAFWLFGVHSLFILMRKNTALLYIFGIYAGVSFGYMPRLVSRIYPWDMPALFLYALCLLVFDKNKYHFLLLLLPLATGFKETAMVWCLAFLFFEMPIQKRIQLCIVSILACSGLKFVIDLMTQNPSLLFTMTWISKREGPRLFYNGRQFLTFPLHPFFVNAGTLVSFLLLPLMERKILALKSVCLIFVAATCIFGMIDEYRIWFELLPLSLYGLERFFWVCPTFYTGHF